VYGLISDVDNPLLFFLEVTDLVDGLQSFSASAHFHKPPVAVSEHGAQAESQDDQTDDQHETHSPVVVEQVQQHDQQKQAQRLEYEQPPYHGVPQVWTNGFLHHQHGDVADGNGRDGQHYGQEDKKVFLLGHDQQTAAHELRDVGPDLHTQPALAVRQHSAQVADDAEHLYQEEHETQLLWVYTDFNPNCVRSKWKYDQRGLLPETGYSTYKYHHQLVRTDLIRILDVIDVVCILEKFVFVKSGLRNICFIQIGVIKD